MNITPELPNTTNVRMALSLPAPRANSPTKGLVASDYDVCVFPHSTPKTQH